MAESSDGQMPLDVASTSSADLSTLLRQKEHDIEIAAQIGQSLLERNRELQMRNEFLEESLSQSNEQAIQLRHELHRRIELLRFFSIDDDELGNDGDASTSSLCRQLERLRRENLRLTAESNVLRRDLEGKDNEQRRAVFEIEAQLTSVTTQAAKLQASITKKNEECAIHGENISRLIDEVARRSTREKDLTEENENLIDQLEEALARENELAEQMNGMQNLYAELKTMFHDAEEELRSYRKKPSPYRTPSVDSLYDSLASELETSDSGRWTPRNRRDAAPRQLQYTSPEAIEPAKEESTPTANGLSLAEELAITSEAETTETAAEPLTTKTLEAIEEPPPPDPPRAEEPKEPTVPDVPEEPIPEAPTPPVEETKEDLAKEVVKDDLKTKDVVVERSLLFSYDSEISLAVPPQKKMPEYIDTPEDEQRPPSRTSSSTSLADYEAPSLGEPGVPGTRDLRASIKKNVRRQLERDYAAFRAKRGLRPSSFFPDGATTFDAVESHSILSPYLVGDARSVLPWRMCSAVGLQGVRSISGDGVLTRAELPPIGGLSPSSSPSHSSPIGGGLRISALSSFTPSGGILLRRPFI